MTGEIGYSIVSRLTVGLVFGGFLLGALALGFVLRRSRRPELLGWLGPAAALGAAALLYVLGETSRLAAPPTTAVVQIVDAVPGVEEAAVHGLVAVYRPDSGPVEAGASQGGLFEPDVTAADGQSRSQIQTDMDAWHLENLSLPAGLRTASFHYTVATGEPLSAIGRFGPDGVEGKLTTGPFHDLTDAVIHSPNGRTLAVRLGPDGAFRAGETDILPAGQFLAGAVLTDLPQGEPGLAQSDRKLTARNPATTMAAIGSLKSEKNQIDRDSADAADAAKPALKPVKKRVERQTAHSAAPPEIHQEIQQIPVITNPDTTHSRVRAKSIIAAWFPHPRPRLSIPDYGLAQSLPAKSPHCWRLAVFHP